MTWSVRPLAAALLLGLALVAGCGGTPDRAATAGATRPVPAEALTPATKQPRTPSPPTAPAAEPAPSASPAPGPAFVPSRHAFINRCRPTGALQQRLERLAPRVGAVEHAESGSRLPVAVVGHGEIALVVLHGEAGDACRAQELLATAGSDGRFTVVAVDLCTSPVARCRGLITLDDGAQAGLVVDRVRASYRPDKVVVLGVGEGGAAAVRAAAVGLPADAVVNVSGAPTAADLRRVTVPMLHLHEDASGADASAARTVAREGSRIVRVTDAPASGWAALTRRGALTGAGADVLAFAAR